MTQSSNVNIESITPLSTPGEIKELYPASEELMQQVVDHRNQIKRILDRQEKKLMIITGPCSIHSEKSALEYGRRLLALQKKVGDKIFLIMRAYFEKPRTTVGWKGMMYDPDLNNSYNIEKGLREARKIFRELVMMGLPTATEILEPIIPQYIADLVSWTAIGARTTESQTHRQLTSGLSMPIGFKNATDGNVHVAVNAITSSASKHAFIGITDLGKISIFKSKGNKYGHVVLRGGNTMTNYSSECIAFTRIIMEKAGITPNIIVDCSHANSSKEPRKQLDVMQDVITQISNGEDCIVGTMIESHIKEGSQSINSKPVDPEISITDACIGWEDTEACILEAHERLSKLK
ncbi:MAG: 3-deoxy-7-phosphoheptulonate synthase [Victivallales bacterium]|nr:3-deoxy-7-phosphoheptulonate synthase [Victivallales bacterium]